VRPTIRPRAADFFALFRPLGFIPHSNLSLEIFWAATLDYKEFLGIVKAGMPHTPVRG